MAACGTIGLANHKCNYKCAKCLIKCNGKYASSLKASIGKEEFICSCKNNSTIISTNKSNYIVSENKNKRICLIG